MRRFYDYKKIERIDLSHLRANRDTLIDIDDLEVLYVNCRELDWFKKSADDFLKGLNKKTSQIWLLETEEAIDHFANIRKAILKIEKNNGMTKFIDYFHDELVWFSSMFKLVKTTESNIYHNVSCYPLSENAIPFLEKELAKLLTDSTEETMGFVSNTKGYLKILKVLKELMIVKFNMGNINEELMECVFNEKPFNLNIFLSDEKLDEINSGLRKISFTKSEIPIPYLMVCSELEKRTMKGWNEMIERELIKFSKTLN